MAGEFGSNIFQIYLVLVYYLPMAAIAAANVFDMWQFSKTATDGLNTHMQ